MSESKQDLHTDILGHRINYFYRGEGAPTTLDEGSVEHVKKLLKQDYREGELCYFDATTETEYRGWWSIQFPASQSEDRDSGDRYTEICGHRIAYHYDGEGAPESMDEASVEHVQKLIEQDYRQGELCYFDPETETDYSGWWSIDD